MSDYETKEGNGSAFKNQRKTEEKHPTHTGEVKLNGKLHFLDVWLKKDRNGNAYVSLRIGKEKTGKRQDTPVMDKTKAGGFVDDFLSDENPF
jgi:hypothetical protein